jgi:FkbM family methyltransferase
MISFIKSIKNKFFNRFFGVHPSTKDPLANVQFMGTKIQFVVSNNIERWRIDTLFIKEPQTIRWIQDYIQDGDVFYDIGANIGAYSLLAAIAVSKNGRVYAFEPHAFNFTKLLTNISVNNLNGIVIPMSCALGDKIERLDFNYKDIESGSSDSQLGTLMDMNEREFVPRCIEAKVAETIDHLVAQHALEPPTHIKIDVDGNELLILSGMRNTLTTAKPRPIQVEVNQRYKSNLFELLNQCGYKEVVKGYTMYGQQRIDAGDDPSLISYNALFVPM